MASDIPRHEHFRKSDLGLIACKIGWLAARNKVASHVEAVSDQSPISRRTSLRSFWKLCPVCLSREGRFQLASEVRPTVIVIEDDPSVRRSLRRLIATAGFTV